MGRISMPQGRGSLKHNIRDYTMEERKLHDNIDFDRTEENIVFKHMDIKDAYEEIFGDYVREYNAKQKRNDRKIKNDDYLSKIKTSKNGEHVFYEDVLQWGTYHDFYNRENREKAKKALVKYINGFEERNPNLKLIGAYIHMDEASPHLHFDYIPIATGYKTGLPVRNSLSKAMEQMGYIVKTGACKDNNQTMLWKEHEREYFGALCEEVGLEVEPEQSWGRSTLSVKEYQEAANKMMDEVSEYVYEEVQANKEAAIKEIEQLQTEAKEKISSEMKWIEARKNTIRVYENANKTFVNFFRDQLHNVKKVLAKVSGLVLSSSTFILRDNNVSNETYTITNTNAYPVIAESEKYDFSYSFNEHEELTIPAYETIAKELANSFITKDISVSKVELSPEIKRRNYTIENDMDL